MGVSKTSDHIQIKIKMSNPSQEPTGFSKDPSQYLDYIHVLCTFKIKNIGVSFTHDHIQIKMKLPNPSQEPPGSYKAPNEDLKDIHVLCTFKIKRESQNSDHGCIKDQCPYENQNQYAKTKSGTSRNLQNPKSVLKGH